MPQFHWSTEPTDLIKPFEVKHHSPEAGALFAWARYAVEELFYLDDLDSAFEESGQVIGNHNPDIVDVAHARWALGTCITALDLCAAAFGRTFCGNTSHREFDMNDFRNQNSARSLLLCQKAPAALSWINRVWGDADYKQTRSARRSMTHSRLPRHFVLNAGSSDRERLALNIDGQRVPVRQVIEIARGVAVRHIPVVLSILPTL